MARLALSLAVALALATPAQASTWSPATPPYGCPVGFGYTQAGQGFAVGGYQGSVGEPDAPPMVSGYWAQLSPDTIIGKTGRLPFEPTSFALFERAGFGAAGYVGRGGTLREPVAQYALLGKVTSGPGKARRLGSARYRSPIGPAITVSAKGKAVALFGGTRRRVRELLLATGGFRKATLIVRGARIGDAVLAGNSGGRTVIAWRNGDGVYARIRTAAGKLLKAQRLGSTGNVTTIKAAVAERGQALVAWAGEHVAGGMTVAPRTIRIAFALHGKTFGRARTIGRIFQPPVYSDASKLGAGFAADRGVIAWTSTGGVSAEILGRDGKRLAAARVSPRGVGAHLADVATDPTGIAAVSWTTSGADLAPYMSLVLPTANAFAAPERISDANASDDARLAIDPVSGAILALGPSSPLGCWFSWRAP
jgi:hypothetical protein